MALLSPSRSPLMVDQRAVSYSRALEKSSPWPLPGHPTSRWVGGRESEMSTERTPPGVFSGWGTPAGKGALPPQEQDPVPDASVLTVTHWGGSHSRSRKALAE